MAPIIKKLNSGPAGKSGTGKSSVPVGSSGGKGAKPLSPKIGGKTTVAPKAAPSTSGKGYGPVFTNPKSKPSSTFGIIWLPSRKHKHKKEVAYNSHRNDPFKERGPSMYNFMSGDSNNQNKTEEDSEKSLLVPDKMPTVIAGVSATAAVVEETVGTTSEDKEVIVDSTKPQEDNKEASGDSKNKDKNYEDNENLENNDNLVKTPENKLEKETGEKGDKVDSVYLRPPPPHKARSNNPSPPAQEEDCGITCLYYVLQCCDCVLM